MTWKQVCKSWVLAQDGSPLGRVRDMVVNPHTGVIPALWVQAANGMKLLSISEINRWNRNEIFVDSPTALIFPEEFPRLEEVLNEEIQIIKAPVFEGKVQTGRCNDFSFDTLSPQLISIEVVHGAFLWKRSKVVHRRHILEIKPEGIFVSIPTITEKLKTTASAKILQGSIPEPEISESFRRE